MSREIRAKESGKFIGKMVLQNFVAKLTTQSNPALKSYRHGVHDNLQAFLSSNLLTHLTYQLDLDHVFALSEPRPTPPPPEPPNNFTLIIALVVICVVIGGVMGIILTVLIRRKAPSRRRTRSNNARLSVNMKDAVVLRLYTNFFVRCIKFLYIINFPEVYFCAISSSRYFRI